MTTLSIILSGMQLFSTTRADILDRAENFAEMTWFADSANTVAWEQMYTEYGCAEHQTSDWEAGIVYQGMAYSYGGNDDTLIYVDKLQQDSLGAGNHMCHYLNYGAATGIYPPDWTAGIDCSAYVCRCWGVPRTNTTGLYNTYYPVDKSEIEPGDILVKPGSHTVIIADPGEDPPYGFLAIYESSGSACRVWYNPDASWSAYSDYSARSLFDPGIADTVTPGIVTTVVCAPQLSRGEVVLRFPPVADGDILFTIHDVAGQKVFSGSIPGTRHETSWTGLDGEGRSVPSGVYYVVVTCPATIESARFIIIR